MSDWDLWFESVEFFVVSRGKERQAFTPACNVYETPSHLVIQVALPGVRKQDIRLVIQDDVLVIAGERREPTADPERRYHTLEFGYGPFERRVPLPALLDYRRIESHLEDGILTVRIAKRDRVVQEIQVQNHDE